MNTKDIENINNELAKREAANYVWLDGGELTKDDIMLRTNKELKQLLDDHINKQNNVASNNVKKIVDEMFAKYGKGDDNMIVISAAYCPERSTVDIDDPLGEINFCWYDYNKLYLPICRDWDCRGYWARKEKTETEIAKWDEKWNEYDKDVERLIDEIYKINDVCTAEEYWKDDNDSLNECWYGVIGIMKDYRVVAFVIRDDGMLCDEDDYQSFNNSIICQL